MRRIAVFSMALCVAGAVMPPTAAAPDDLPRARIVYSVYDPAGEGKQRVGIYVRRPGGHPHRLTRGGSDFAAQWSPDRKRIAFVRRGEEPSIYVMWADGRGAVRFAYGSDFDWSPDGRSIAYSGRPLEAEDTGIEALYIGTLAGEHRRLADRAGYPDWSPDGTRIAFMAITVANAEPGEPAVVNDDIFTIGIDGENLTQITDDPYADFDPVWAPDSSRIAFRTLRHDPSPPDEGPYNNEIYLVNDDGTDETRLTDDCHWEEHVSWLPGSNKLLYSTNDDDDACLDPQDDEIMALDVTSGDVTNVTRDQGDQLAPAPSPNGRWVVFIEYVQRGRRFFPELVTLRLSDGHKEYLTGNDRTEAELDWTS